MIQDDLIFAQDNVNICPTDTDSYPKPWAMTASLEGRIDKWQLLDLLKAINQPPEDEEASLGESFWKFTKHIPCLLMPFTFFYFL